MMEEKLEDNQKKHKDKRYIHRYKFLADKQEYGRKNTKSQTYRSKCKNIALLWADVKDYIQTDRQRKGFFKGLWHQMVFILHTTLFSLNNLIYIMDAYSNTIVRIEFSPLVTIDVSNGHQLRNGDYW